MGGLRLQSLRVQRTLQVMAQRGNRLPRRSAAARPLGRMKSAAMKPRLQQAPAAPVQRATLRKTRRTAARPAATDAAVLPPPPAAAAQPAAAPAASEGVVLHRPAPRRPGPRATNATGYTFSPSFDELQAMSADELSAVERFTLARPGVGEVTWVGAVDLRELPLASVDQYVEIGLDECDQPFVAVHPRGLDAADTDAGDNAENAGWNRVDRPPRVGTGKALGRCLDCAARVTLRSVFPTQRDRAALKAWRLDLESICTEQNWAMEGWSCESGDWQFQVERF